MNESTDDFRFAPPERADILIVEDEPKLAELLQKYLAVAGYTSRHVARGDAALDAVRAQRPDLILLDVMMPKLSGFEVCQQLKSDPATSGIMILMVTALNELGDIERAVEAGTNDFLSKPVNRVELLKRVDLNKVRMIAAALFLVIGLWVLAQTAGLFGAG